MRVMNPNRVLAYGILLVVVTVLYATPGCTQYQPPQTVGTLREEDPEYVMIVVLDLSGSYERYLHDGRAWEAMNSMIRQFFRDRSGENDRIIIAQISSNPQGPIWSGSTRAFKAQLGKPAAFRDLLAKYRGASRVHDSITEAVEYALPMMGKGRAGCFVFSDMQDNESAPGGEERLVKAFEKFGRKGGAVGIYWCGFRETIVWRSHLQKAVKNHVVTSVIDADPTLPQWD